MEQAVLLHNHILKCFERAELEMDSKKRNQLLTFAIVDGGRTGVEFSGALIELIRGPLRKEYRSIDFQEPRVLLCHSRGRLISMANAYSYSTMGIQTSEEQQAGEHKAIYAHRIRHISWQHIVKDVSCSSM